MNVPPGFRMIDNWLWPAMDTKCARVIFRMAEDLTEVLKWIPEHRRTACVQAGGNCGVWPAMLAPKFRQVYTAEPHPSNFAALVYNTIAFPNVVRLQAAFGFERIKVNMGLAPHETTNCGAYFVQEGGDIPTLQIDDLNLPACGLIYLDVEGFEQRALFGASVTINFCRPVIVIEDKGLSRKYGTEQGDIEKWLREQHDYIVLQRINRDVVLGHREHYPEST